MKIPLKTAVLPALVFTWIGAAMAQDSTKVAVAWPLREKIDLSSGFGDFRDGRFHAGVDLRTGGTVGRRLFSPVNGYVSRVRMSYEGYGKGLYITDHDGYSYVFGHLSGFIDEIDRSVRIQQHKEKRYYVDLAFPPDSIPVTKGQLIGWTGQTGAGAPHLHFEKRSPANLPLNPLTHGFTFTDTIAPEIRRIALQLNDASSLWSDGTRKIFIDVRRKHGAFVADTTVMYINRPFHFLVDCIDRMSAGGMQQAIYKLELSIDNVPVYQTAFDTLNFDHGKFVKLEYDFVEATEGQKSVRPLFAKPGNTYPASQEIGSSKSLTIGRHTARITATDAFANRSVMEFEFLYGPPGSLFTLDSVTTPGIDTSLFFLTVKSAAVTLDIDSIVVQHCQGKEWRDYPRARLISRDETSLTIRVDAGSAQRVPLRIRGLTRNGVVVDDEIFSGLLPSVQKDVIAEHTIVDDGLVIHAQSSAFTGLEAFAYFYYEGRLLEKRRPDRFYSVKDYFWFVQPTDKLKRIDRIEVKLSHDSVNVRPEVIDSLMIVAVGLGGTDTVVVGDGFQAVVPSESFWEPRFVEFRKIPVPSKRTFALNSDAYQIFPEVFATNKSFQVNLSLADTSKFGAKSGICWLDQKRDRFVWLTDNELESNRVKASSGGGGTFAVLLDHTSPTIRWLNIVQGRMLETLKPKIEFRLYDSLSGIDDDRSITILLDGQWMIPEYDPEREICSFQPLDLLAPGKHTVEVTAVDRAGNRQQEHLEFQVSEPPDRKGARRRRR